MNPVYDKVLKCYECYKNKIEFTPDVALVLGSGLGDFADTMQVEAVLDYKDIDGFPVSTAPGHKGRFVFGYVGDTKVVAMQGRVHYYEGYDITDVVLPIRLMHLMGAKTLFLTNASGGINPDFNAGDLMLITDQISFFVPSPLRGENISEFGVRFPDMSHIYNPNLLELAKKCASKLDIELKEGVYIQTQGPNYESPAEIRLAKAIGADAVGMSTAVEAIAANHMQMDIIGISCIANLAAGISPHPLTEEEVLEAGRMVAKKFTALVNEIISQIK